MHSLVPYETPWIKIRLWGTKITHGAGAQCAFPTTWREEWGNIRAKAKGALVHHRGSEGKAEEKEAVTGGCAWGLWPIFSIWFNPKRKVAFWRVHHCLHKPISTHGLWKNFAGGKWNWILRMAAPKRRMCMAVRCQPWQEVGPSTSPHLTCLWKMGRSGGCSSDGGKQELELSLWGCECPAMPMHVPSYFEKKMLAPFTNSKINLKGAQEVCVVHSRPKHHQSKAT